MNSSLFSKIFLALPVILVLSNYQQPVRAADAKRLNLPLHNQNRSLQNEVQHAIDRGLAWLQTKQDAKGFWSTPDHPAMTALVLTALMGDPSGRMRAEETESVRKGFDFLVGCAKPDGGIYQKGLLNYNTSVSMMALLAANKPQYDALLRKARRFVIEHQGDFNEKGKEDSPFDGGIGYGDKHPHSDMSNTLFALEALYYSKHLKQGQELSEARDLNWPAVVGFIQRCQNLPAFNKESWASDDPQNKGGFIYYPGHSMADEMKLPSGRTALRSYGSMSYAGLLSYVYADLKRDDPRVTAVFDWLRGNFTLEENPGMGAQGLYYYFQAMARALSAYDVDELPLSDGRKIRWRNDLALKLINLQHSEGFWVNDNGRWWEKDPNLVTAYSVIALEIVYRGL